MGGWSTVALRTRRELMILTKESPLTAVVIVVVVVVVVVDAVAASGVVIAAAGSAGAGAAAVVVGQQCHTPCHPGPAAGGSSHPRSHRQTAYLVSHSHFQQLHCCFQCCFDFWTVCVTGLHYFRQGVCWEFQ